MLPILTLPDTTPIAFGASPVLGANAPRLRPRLSAPYVSDPAEPWETPVPRRDRYMVERMLPGRPSRPLSWSEVPEAARAALDVLCGEPALEQYYLVPTTTRLVNKVKWVITPTRVLAFGDTSVGLWIDTGPNGRASAIPIDDIDAVDDRAILLYGRLRLLAPSVQIVVRYNTVSRNEIQQNVNRLRSRMAASSTPVESGFVWIDADREGKTPAELPHKWRVVLDSAAVRPDRAEAVKIATGDVAPIAGRRRPASGVAVLSGRELVIANEPVEYLDRARYGVDLLAVPRRRLDCLHWSGESLTVRVLGREGGEATSVALPIDPCLVEAMWRAFGGEVRWA